MQRIIIKNENGAILAVLHATNVTVKERNGVTVELDGDTGTTRMWDAWRDRWHGGETCIETAEDYDVSAADVEAVVARDFAQPHFAVQTDWDFSVRYKGKLYTGYDFIVPIDSVDDLDEIQICAADGGELTLRTKWMEISRAIAYIKEHPDERYDTTGSNRGVSYWPANYAGEG